MLCRRHKDAQLGFSSAQEALQGWRAQLSDQHAQMAETLAFLRAAAAGQQRPEEAPSRPAHSIGEARRGRKRGRRGRAVILSDSDKDGDMDDSEDDADMLCGQASEASAAAATGSQAGSRRACARPARGRRKGTRNLEELARELEYEEDSLLVRSCALHVKRLPHAQKPP